MGGKGEEVKYATHLARRSMLKIGIVLAIFVSLVAVERIHYQTATSSASARLAKAAQIKGSILLADEKLTMSAYAYASSGNEAMKNRYLEAQPEIDAAIAEARSLASPAAAERFDNETRVANDELVKLEMKSFELVAQHRMGEAASIFTTLAYLNNKRVLGEGSERFLDALEAELAAAKQQRHRLGLSLLAVISATGAAGFFEVSRRLRKALVKSESAFLAADAQIRSELAGAQKEILRKARLAQLGSLTGTMAHELRNPLSGVRAAAFLLKKRLAEKNSNTESLFERINRGVVRCDNVISQLLDYSRTGLAQTPEVDFDTWLADTVERAAENLPPVVEVECTLGLDGQKLNFDLERMDRVVANLITNASEAMVGRSDTSARVDGQLPRICVQSRISPRGVELVVADNGPGISPGDLEKVMEPLFTTKNFGTGLGLPTVKNILEQHGGGLEIASTAGEGATFTAWFPIVSPAREFKSAA